MGTLSRGLVVAGDIVPGTDWILRDAEHFFTPGKLGTRPRAAFTDLLIGHWTAGEAGAKRYDDDGPHVVRVMRARKRTDGSALNVGIHFVIGACEPDALYAPVWQTADPGLCATTHVGRPEVNKRSIGVEVVSAGMPGKLDLRSRPLVRTSILGRTRNVLAFFPGQLRAWTRLAEMLASLDGREGIAIPRVVPAFGASRRFAHAEIGRYSGALEHLHVPGTSKIDAGGLLIGALADAGWERR
jgi:hypothetical protein